ncbi:MAG: competence protein ComEC [Arenicella sp.]
MLHLRSLSSSSRRLLYQRLYGLSVSSTYCLVLFFLGVCATLWLYPLPSLKWLLLGTVIIMVLSVRYRTLRLLLFFLAGLTWACYRFQAFLDIRFPDQYERVDFIANGIIEGLPTFRQGNIQFKFRVSSVANNDLSMLIGQRVQISCYRCPLSIRSGEQWLFTLRVKRPHGYASWGSFDYEKYLFRHRLIAKGYVRLNSRNTRLVAAPSSIDLWRQALFEELHRVVGLGVGSNIIAALSIGVKSGFSNQQRLVFQTTGISHLMAISGLHVGLVFIGVALLLKWLMWPIARIFEYWPRQQLIFLPALLSATFYTALAGFSVSTQRALIMLTVYVVCKFLARDVALIKVLLIAITVLLIVDPFSILDTGFWLSCGAVAVISLVSTKSRSESNQELSETFSKEPSKNLNLLRLQPVLWLGMLPLSVIFFGKISLISPLVNLVAVPLFCALLIPATLLSVFLYGVGFKALGVWCMTRLSTLFDSIFDLLLCASQLEFAKIYSTPLVWWQWPLFALVMYGFFRPIRIQFICGAVLVGSVFINTANKLAEDELQVTLLDVGQGLAMVIETVNSVTVYDTGPRYGTGFTAAEAVLLPFLRQRGVRRINTLVISHADNDHIGGLSKVLEAFDVGRTVSSRLDKVAGAIKCTAGQSWQYDHTVFRVISPQVDTPNGSNNHSCVLMLQHFDINILLSGDIEKQVERFLLRKTKYPLAADILLVPHQGSKTSSTAAFLDAVSPKIGILAAGYKNHYGHPHSSVVDRYNERSIDLLSTIEHGSVLLKINSHTWTKVLYRQRYRRFWHYQKVPNRSA